MRRAFSLIELLVTLGIISLLVALALPLLSQTKGKSLAVRSLSNIRQIGLGLAGYAGDHRGYPPVLGSSSAGAWSFEFQEYKTDNWFAHKWLYSLAITSYLSDVRVANAPGKPDSYKVVEFQGGRASLADYTLSPTLYADPAFFRWDTQRGAAQFHAQRLDSISFPADKGILSCAWLYHFPQYGPVPACCVYDLASPVLFADFSASEYILRRLRPGITNIYDADVVLAPGADPRSVDGPPVIGTVGGASGRDRW